MYTIHDSLSLISKTIITARFNNPGGDSRHCARRHASGADRSIVALVYTLLFSLYYIQILSTVPSRNVGPMGGMGIDSNAHVGRRT
jgi:hypothetical protein